VEASFETAVHFLHSLGFNRGHATLKFLAKLTVGELTAKYKISINSIIEILSRIEECFESAYPGYAHSPPALQILRHRIGSV
jgi:hypothetical protein